MAAAGAYPVRVDASLDSPLSRWLWLVKWVLVIPHYFVLAFLWLAFVVLSVVAFFAILFTERYPRGIFEFNVGVLRWTWRVQYYAIGGFGTDKYPPFTLADDPSYPAHLEIDYPARLSRGLVLVKWWLLAIPQYIIVGVFTGSGVWFAWQYGRAEANWAGIGLIGILAVIAAVVLLVTGEYPRQIFDFVLGMNRWVLRVAAYAGLMTDAYPPFRLDMGGHEPGGTLTVPPPATGVEGTPWQPEQAAPAEPTPSGPGPSGPAPGVGRPPGWTAGRIVSVVIGAVLVLCSLGMLGGGAGALWATTVHRSGGYVDLGTQTYRTTGHALASRQIELYTAAGGWDVAQSLFGTVRLRVTATEGTPVFAGIARAGAADRYLSGMAYATVTGTTRGHPSYLGHAGGAPAVLPARAGIWTVKAAGPGTQTLVWQVANGRWTVVAMNADATAPVSVRVNAAATLPALPWVATGLLIAGGVFLLAGVLLIAFPLRGASRQHTIP
ncbi:MAG TPA: DUF4389 domain-containing protein [Streptosporangiaceae bacterium]|nr:DUF4389 domain-containing protein [Streptosporangiaceae bacterium]